MSQARVFALSWNKHLRSYLSIPWNELGEAIRFNSTWNKLWSIHASEASEKLFKELDVDQLDRKQEFSASTLRVRPSTWKINELPEAL